MPIFSIYSCQGQKFPSNAVSWTEVTGTEFFFPLSLPVPFLSLTTITGFLTSNTLLFQLFCVYAVGLVRPYPPKLRLCFSPRPSLKHQSCYVRIFSFRFIMRHWGLRYFHDAGEGSDLTMGHPLLVALCSQLPLCLTLQSARLCWPLWFPFFSVHLSQ